jgi:hypothetical protein
MNVRIAQLVNFNAGTWFDGALEMNEYTIKLWMMTQTYDALEQNIAMQRVKHFLYSEIENTIFVNSEEQEKCADLIRVGLNVTSMPGEPADQLIGIMLFHKLNAIMEDRIRIVEIEISAGGGVIYMHSEDETSDLLTYPDWWSSADATHCDPGLKDSDKVLSIPLNWRDLELAWPVETQDNVSGNIVVFADFKQPDDSK